MQKHRGEILYDNLCLTCEGSTLRGKPIQLLIIGRQALALIEEHFSEINRRPMTLQEIGFAGRNDLPIWVDERDTLRISPLVNA
jgi:hypothetical protein